MSGAPAFCQAANPLDDGEELVAGVTLEDVAKQLASLASVGGANAETYKIYASQPRVHEAAEIKVTKNLAYGPHERQQLDIHTATLRRADRPVPIVVVFHGGGLVGGSRANTTTVADYFASIGLVGVNAGYRLAPDSKWPEGGRDVGAAVTWLRNHAAEHGGDPEQICVVGVSTGALHIATYLFRPELMPAGPARPARPKELYHLDPLLRPRRVLRLAQRGRAGRPVVRHRRHHHDDVRRGNV